MSQEPSTSGNRGRIWRHSQVVRDLPPEVMDMIFDLLRPLNWDAQRPPGAFLWRSGREELMACYAVSRFWRESARRHLFRDFVVNFRCELPPPPGMLADLYASHSRPTAYWLPDLPALFQFLNDSPAITKYIRRLRLHCNVAVQLPKIQPGVLLGVLRSVPNLRVLHLSNVALTVPPPQSVPRLETPLSRLQLSYSNTRDESWRISDLEITQLLDCFIEIEELHLLGQGPLDTPRVDLDDYRGPSKLRVEKLVLQRRWNRGVLFKHLVHASLDNVRCLVLRQVSLYGVDIELFPAFLRSIGPRLQELRVYLNHDHREGTCCLFLCSVRRFHIFAVGAQVIDVSLCRNLKELTVGFILPVFVSVQCQKALDEALSNLSLASFSRERFPSLQDIVLEITFDAKTFRSVSDPDENWVSQLKRLETLDRVLVSAVERCGSAKVWFECICPGELLNCSDMVALMLPQLHRRGYAMFREPRDGVWQM